MSGFSVLIYLIIPMAWNIIRISAPQFRGVSITNKRFEIRILGIHPPDQAN